MKIVPRDNLNRTTAQHFLESPQRIGRSHHNRISTRADPASRMLDPLLLMEQTDFPRDAEQDNLAGIGLI
jgi:hypothetical protein